MKKAILVVFPATACRDARESVPFAEKTLGGAYPGCEIRCAFIDAATKEEPRQREKKEADSFSSAMERLEEEGITHVAVQPVHTIRGEEYKKLLFQLEPFRKTLCVYVGEPLPDGKKGYAQAVDALESWLASRDAEEGSAAKGKLWGIGVGPGDPELLTLKAARILEQSDVVLAPDTGRADKTALNIVSGHLNGKKPILVPMPMTRDPEVLEQAHQAAAEKIAAYLDDGKQVAFITLGDATVYSTYMYVHEKVRAMGYDVEVVPGVPSFCAAAARLNISLCQGSEPLLIIPASHDAGALLDVPANKVFMKAGYAILDLKKTLEEKNMLGNAAMVENCSMENERVYPNFRELDDHSGYFSLVIVK